MGWRETGLEDVLLEMLAACNDFISGRHDGEATLERLANLGAAALDAEMAGLSLNDVRGGPKTVIYTDRMVPEIDRAQYEANRGPCLDASRERQVYRVTGDQADWDRWPEFVAEAESRGIHSSVSVPVVVRGESAGALNFYAAKRSHFDDGRVRTGQAFASQMAIVMAYRDKAELAEQLEVSMESRAAIEQAKGVLMASMGCTPDEAFDLLVQQSQDENRKLRDVAAALVARHLRANRP